MLVIFNKFKYAFFAIFLIFVTNFVLKLFFYAAEIDYKLCEIEIEYNGFLRNESIDLKKYFPHYNIRYRKNDFDDRRFLIISFSGVIPFESELSNIVRFIDESFFYVDSFPKYKIKKNQFLTPKNIEIILWILSILFVFGLLGGLKCEGVYAKED